MFVNTDTAYQPSVDDARGDFICDKDLSLRKFCIIIYMVIYMENQLPMRKPLRLESFDYNTAGAYFLTFCTHNRRNILSHIVGAIHESPESQLTNLGEIVDTVINQLPRHFPVTIDSYVIMPNHVHLMLIIDENTERAIRESPLRSHSLISKAIGYVKMNASKEIHTRFGSMEVWQRGYYDHVIRNQADYDMIAQYISQNPLRWELDKLYTAGEM